MIGSEHSAPMGHGKTGRSKGTKFTADFFAAEIRAWHGEEALWKVFWVYGVAISVTIVVLYIVAFYDGCIALRQVLLPFFATYTAWILVSVWRCASNTKEKMLEYARTLPDRGLGREYDSRSDLPPTQPLNTIFSTLGK